jgi:hypothetical protein
VAAVIVAGFLIGFDKSGVAGAIGPLVTVAMALVLPADDAIGVLLPMLLVGDVFSVIANWRRWDGQVLRPLVVSGLVGVGIGSLLLSAVDETGLRRLIAVVMLLFLGWYAWNRRPRIAPRAVAGLGWLSGLAGGLLSALAHMGGPPVVIYLMAAGSTPARLVGTSVVFFAAANVLKIPGYLAAGVLDFDLIAASVWGWVAIPIGVWAGRRLVDRIRRERFEPIVIALLGIGAVILLFR